MAVTKRTLVGIRERIESAIRQLKYERDMQHIIDMDLSPALKDLDYAIEMVD